MTTGTELIRRKAAGEAFVFTNPLITKSDGGKFGKTEQGNVWLDPIKTTPFQFYQFWLNAADSDAEKWIRIFTFLPKEEIESLIAEHQADPSKRILQKRLAQEVTSFVHGEEEYVKALETTSKLFSAVAAPVESLSPEDLQNLEGIVRIDYPRNKLDESPDIVSFLADMAILPSKGEARKMIQNGGVSINRKKVEGVDFKLDASLLLHNEFLLIQKGKKTHYLLRVQ
jgi:tyrosyl-tRNA synthetase